MGEQKLCKLTVPGPNPGFSTKQRDRVAPERPAPHRSSHLTLRDIRRIRA